MRRIVSISGGLPHEGVDHAGGFYVTALVRELSRSASVRVLCPDTPSNLGAAAGHPPGDWLLVGATAGHAGPPALARWAQRVDELVRRVDPALPPLPLALALALDPDVWSALRTADVVDLQWPDYGRLIPLLRALGSRAPIVVTMHDVLSQRYSRQSERATGRLARAKWGLLHWRATRWER